ncbi:MAG: D-glucuronyl C5-epimerase family protein [Pseudomonas capeferrum]|jgi:hypothetical protein|uniref:D-glucuronyl C5-epimerase family protein n=1 Tax=Pseudomonas sp. 39004 TaxID=2967213 RepID=UPI0023633585|nr:D-glucuronyl C5-epimerase family protein [Pseudomonas sp. 39004]MDD1960966.1 hypothetical protein [Pseudomonas sp. 39004]
MHINYEALTTDWFDRAMGTGPQGGKWKPKHHLDLYRPWPEQYVADFNQPFNPFAFAINACALASTCKVQGPSKVILDQIDYLDLAASIYTDTLGNHNYIRNDFSFPMYWATMKRPFYGAFMNAYTAYGYMRIFEATHDEKHLNKALKLISTITSNDTKLKLSEKDSRGDLWLYEYVFTPLETDAEHFKKLGTETQPDGTMRFRIYNGHIGALIALLKFRKLTNMGFVDETIEQALLTMSKNLGSQLLDNQFFSYSIEAPQLPDYGQARAVHLAKQLSEATDDEQLKLTYQAFDKFYRESIKDREKEVYAAGRATARELYSPLKSM